jgi:CheY-like chemotaxis protein
VLLDLKLPKIDGYEVLARAKRDPALRVVPIVVFSSSHEDRDIAASYELGANAYVVKPVAFDDFIEAVGRTALYWAAMNEPPPSCRPCEFRRY